jgi:2'-5' RNA ligase
MNERQVRIFFALWPDAVTRRNIFRTYQSVDDLAGVGRAVKIQNLHMTLHFIGNVAEADLDCFVRAGDAISIRPFNLKLTTCGTFANARVSWLGCHVFPLQLSELHEQLARNLQACGYSAEARPFRPHVTMARKIAGEHASRTIQAVRWPVKRFVLLESVTDDRGVMYRVRHSWPLK